MIGEIYLVGGFHLDLKGEGRLYNALRSLEPDLITVEYIPDSEIPQKETNKAIRYLIEDLKNDGHERSDIAEIARLVRKTSRVEGFENRAVKRYAKEFGVSYHKIGEQEHENTIGNIVETEYSDSIKKHFLGPVFSLGSRDNFQRYYIESRYQRIRQLYDDGVPAEDEEAALNWGYLGQRDIAMSSRIREFSEQDSSKRIVHVGGADHFCDSPTGTTIFSQLSDLNPQRVLLNEFEEVAA